MTGSSTMSIFALEKCKIFNDQTIELILQTTFTWLKSSIKISKPQHSRQKVTEPEIQWNTKQKLCYLQNTDWRWSRIMKNVTNGISKMCRRLQIHLLTVYSLTHHTTITTSNITHWQVIWNLKQTERDRSIGRSVTVSLTKEWTDNWTELAEKYVYTQNKLCSFLQC